MDVTPPAKVVIITTEVSVHFRLYKLSTIYTELIVYFKCAICSFKNGSLIFFSAVFFLLAGPQVVGNLFLEVIRAFYSYCRDALASDLQLSYTQSGNSLIRYDFQLYTLPPFLLP